MKSSTTKLGRTPRAEGFSLTREQGEKIAAVEGLVLSERMKRIIDRPISDDEKIALIKETFQKK